MSDHAEVRYLVPALLAMTMLAGCGGETDPAATPAGRAQARVMDDLYTGRYDRAYASLYPAHRRLVSSARFAECAKATTPTGLDTLEVLDVYDHSIHIPGVTERTAKAVRVRVALSSGETTTFVNHEVKVGDRWYWVFNAPSVAAYKTGRCPGL